MESKKLNNTWKIIDTKKHKIVFFNTFWDLYFYKSWLSLATVSFLRVLNQCMESAYLNTLMNKNKYPEKVT